MSIWVKENRIISFLRNFSTLTRIWISFLIVLIFCLSWIFFLRQPLLCQVEKTKKELETLEEENLRLKKEIIQCERLKKENDQVFLELKNKSSFCSFIKDYSDYILGFCRKYNLSCSKIEQGGIKQKEFCSKKDFNLFVLGKFQNFLDFFSALEKSSVPLKIKKVCFDRGLDGKIRLELGFRAINEMDIEQFA